MSQKCRVSQVYLIPYHEAVSVTWLRLDSQTRSIAYCITFKVKVRSISRKKSFSKLSFTDENRLKFCDLSAKFAQNNFKIKTTTKEQKHRRYLWMHPTRTVC